MKPIFGDIVEEGFGAELHCPNCGGIFLHHQKIEIFERSEDEGSGVHVIVEGKKATIDQDLTGNPSYRRHGLTIQFWCEGCNAHPVMTLIQHKGNTYIEMQKGG